MGIADRDYARASATPPPGGGSLMEFFRLLSFNSWLIGLNVFVFLLTAWFMSGPAFQRPLALTPEYVATVSAEQLRTQQPAPGATLPTRSGDATLVVLVSPIIERGNEVLPGPNGFLARIGQQTVISVSWLQYWGHFSTASGFFGLEVWRFVTFQFLHANFLHLALNVLALYFVGAMVEEYLGSRRYAAFYLVCGVFGAVMYLALNFLGYVLLPMLGVTKVLPFLLPHDIRTPLVGASAGIFGILVAAAWIDPRREVLVLGLIPARIRTVVVLLIAVSLYNLYSLGTNAGGEAAHIGGALAGWFFVRRMHLLRDFFDVLGKPKAPRPRSSTSPSRAAPPPPPLIPPSVDQARVDAILDKIRTEGLASLTDDEKATLARASNAPRARGRQP